MSNSAKLVSSLGQGDGGLSESCKAGQGVWVLEYVSNDADRSGLLPFICSAAGTRSPPQVRMCKCGVVPGSQREQGDAGMSGYRKPGYPLGNSLHML